MSRDETARTARAWIVQLASGGIGAREMRRFERWLAASAAHRDAFDRERRFWHDIEGLEESFRTAPAPRRRWRLPAMGAALAACLALVVLWGDVETAVLADYRTEVGAQRAVALPDGSVAHLDTDTAIALRYAAGERRIDLLRGEALFEVAPDPDMPFRVVAVGGAARALGTVFVVRAGDEGARVAVTEGRVAVTSPAGAGAAVELRAGEGTAYRRGAAPRPAEKAPPGTVAAWRRGKIAIDGLPLSEALAELDRYRPGRILLLDGAAATRPVSGVFDTARIDEAVDALAATQGLTATRITPYLFVLR